MPGTAPTNDILNWFRVQRLLAFAQKVGETFPSIARGGSYGESVMELLTDKQHKVADEGSYYMTRSPTVGTGLATIAAQNSFADTSPFLIVTNGNPAGGKSIYLDYLKLTTTVAGTNGTTPCGVGNAMGPGPGVAPGSAQPRAVWHNALGVGGRGTANGRELGI